MNEQQTLAIEQGKLFQNAKGQWCKRCPKCDGEQPYYDKFNAHDALKRNAMCHNCRHEFKPHTSNRGKNQWPSSRSHDESKPTVIQFTVLDNPLPVEVTHSSFNQVSVTMVPVTVNCACGYSSKRKVPWLPFRISWHCQKCFTNHQTNFSRNS